MENLSNPENPSGHKSVKRSGKPQDRPINYMKYSGMAMQMGAIILVGVWAGQKLDERLQSNGPWFTVTLALLSIFAALYMVLKDLFNKPT